MRARDGRPRRLRPFQGVAWAAIGLSALTPFFAREARLVAWAGPGSPPVPTEHSPDITRGELEGWVRLLADDSFEGRESGEPGCDRAADLIAAEFARVGLRPLGDGAAGGPTYFQNFTIPRGMKVLKATSLTATGADGRAIAFRLAEDFVPVDVSASGDVTGCVVFAGYGIHAPDLGYDDYDGLDVKGKVVVVLRRAPAYEDRKSPFSAPAVLEKHASFQAKAEAAIAAGAAALVIVNDPGTSTTKEKDDLKPPGGGTAGKIPVVQVQWRGAGKRLGDALGLPLSRLEAQIDAKGMPRSVVAENVTLHVRCALEPDVRHVRNVAGLLVPERTAATTGETPPADASLKPPSPGVSGNAPARETLVVGAHYDHVGRGRFGSLANAEGKIHNGADDNASGTSALLEVAGWLASRRGELTRNVLFLAFSGEELGLLGSKHYVEAPLLPLADCVAMVNLDMVGRLDERLYVGGTGTSPVWPDLLERLNRETSRLPLKMWPGGKAPSDHESFYGRDLPVLFFFTGLHPDYHRPSDDWNTLNYDGHAKVTRLAAAVALDVATRKDRPAFTKCDAGGFEVGPYLGAGVAARAAGVDGVVVSHVDDKGPAKKAGLKEGDILLEWNGALVKDPNAFNDLLSKGKQGDKVELSIERKGKRLKVTVTIGST